MLAWFVCCRHCHFVPDDVRAHRRRGGQRQPPDPQQLHQGLVHPRPHLLSAPRDDRHDHRADQHQGEGRE